MRNSDSSRSRFAGASTSFKRGLGAVVSCAALMCSNGFVLGQTCGTQGQFCASNAGCDDGDPCNGTETCSPPDIIRFCRCASTLPCDDGDECTLDICTNSPRGLRCDHEPGGCSDGVYCNGVEVCVPIGGCVSVPPPCTEPLLCDEANDRCVKCLDASDCLVSTCWTPECNTAGNCDPKPCFDDLFCNGREICVGAGVCLPGVPPCPQTEACEEGAGRCGQCSLDTDCLDGDPCNSERCDDWAACRTEICRLAFDAPPEGSSNEVGAVVDVVGRGPRGLDVVLVFDESGSISATQFVQLKDFAISLVQGFRFTSNGTATRVGVTMFSSGARRVLNLNGNFQTILSTINGMTKRGGGTCIGCGIDDASANLLLNGREGAAQWMIVLTDGENVQGAPGPAEHLAGAIQATKQFGHVVFAIGVGSDVNPGEIQAIATDIPGVQTAFFAGGFAELAQVREALFMAAGSEDIDIVRGQLPDGSDFGVLVDPAGEFVIPDWVILPGENLFSARIGTLYGERTASLTLIGLYPCSSVCGDLNGDGRVDLRDVAEMQLCFGGRQWASPICACADLDGDTRIDLSDHAAFVSALQSPSKNAPPDCPAP